MRFDALSIRNAIRGTTQASLRVCSLFFGACIVTSTVFAECTLPPPPSKIPDGATASDEEMQAIMSTMAHFESDVESYVKCLAFEASQGRLSSQNQISQQTAALERHQATMNLYNAQMRLYMAR